MKISNLKNLAETKSIIREDIEKYLESIIEALDTTELYFDGKVISISDIAVEPFVITKELKFEPSRFEQKKGGTDKFESNNSGGNIIADIQAEHYERLARSEIYKKNRWSQEINKQGLRLAVKGEPGGGKTFISKNTAIETAARSIQKLNGFDGNLEDIEISIWLTANELSEFEFSTEGKNKIADNLIKIIKNKTSEINLTDRFYKWLEKQIQNAESNKTADFFIFIDALDELVNENSFTKASKMLYKFSAKIIVTCRTMQWETQQSLLHWRDVTEVSLAPFTNTEQQQAIDNFFDKQRGLAEEKRNELKESLQYLWRNNYALQNSFQSPLLLTFVCLLHLTGDLDVRTTQINLYERMIKNIFNGKFCPTERKPYWTERKSYQKDNLVGDLDPDDNTDMLLDLFDEIGWQLFSASPGSKIFTLIEWNEAFATAIDEVRRFHPEIEEVAKSSRFRAELKKIRLLITASNIIGKNQSSFLHKTILEFISARSLSKRANWLEEAQKHFWDFTWLETLTFLAGLVDDVKPLIEAVRREKPDIFGTMILLEAKFTGVSNIADVELICDKIIFCLLDRDWLRTISYKPKHKNRIIGNQTISYELIDMVFKILQVSKKCQDYFSGNLINPLIETLSNSKNNDDLPIGTAEALGKLGKADDKVIDYLIETLTHSDNYYSRRNAAEALGKSGKADDKVIDCLIETLRNSDNIFLRIYTAEALVELGKADNKVIDCLIENLANSNHFLFLIHFDLLMRVAKVLSTLGKADNKVIEVLIESFTHANNDYSRTSIAEALVELGKADDKVIDFLIETLSNSGSYNNLSIRAANALGKICETVKGKINRQDLFNLIKLILLNLNGNKILLYSSFSEPLFQIWQTCRTNENNLKITWDLLDKDEKDFVL